jgi:hypothetical protein
MSYKSLTELPADIIKAHILNPENSPLPVHYQELFGRVVSMTKILQKQPVTRNAIKFHRALYPDISIKIAYSDLHLARQLFTSYQDFDFDFWMTWTINNIHANIAKCQSTNTSADRKIIAQENANLVRLLGKKPEIPVDPLRNEKHNFFIMVDINNKRIKVDADELHQLPLSSIKELNRAIFSGNEIDEQGAVEIMNS